MEEIADVIRTGSKLEQEEDYGGPTFCPPLYQQRYRMVVETLQRPEFNQKIKKVIDFGCAECKLFNYLKEVSGIEEILEVDKDEMCLEYGRCTVAPKTYNFLHKRETPLVVRLLAGSIAEPDSRLEGAQAVICVEIIEHLPEDILDKAPDIIFGYIHPELVIITTPNSDYNVLFPSLMSGKFRHWDHRFEWSQKEFAQWCKKVLSRFPCYMLELTGLGEPTEGNTHLGYCTQIAIFRRGECALTPCPRRTSDTTDSVPYKLIAEYEYPWKAPTIPTEADLEMEVDYYLRFLLQARDKQDEDIELHQFPISLLRAFPRLANMFPTNDKLREFLTEHGYNIMEKDNEWCVEYQSSTDGEDRDDDEFDDDDRQWSSTEEQDLAQSVHREIAELSDIMADMFTGKGADDNEPTSPSTQMS